MMITMTFKLKSDLSHHIYSWWSEGETKSFEAVTSTEFCQPETEPGSSSWGNSGGKEKWRGVRGVHAPTETTSL